MSEFYKVKGGAAPVFLKGQARFAKLASLDQWGKWSCSIYPDQESINKVHKLISEGIKNKLVKDEDGYRITFSRPAKLKTKTKGDVDMDPVELTDAQDHLISDRFIPDGSEITMQLECYGGPSPSGYGLYKAARLKAIKIHNTATTAK